MTTDIKAAIAGAIEALEKNVGTFQTFALLHSAKRTDEGREKARKNLDMADATRSSLDALRRIEFVEVDRKPDVTTPMHGYDDAADSYTQACIDYREGWNDLCDHLTTTGHAIVKMGGVDE